MLPPIRTHAQYQSFVLKQLRTHYSGGVLMLVAKDWSLIEKFWLVDLSATASLLSPQYATRGIKATDPANLLRSYLLMMQVGRTSITEWVDELRRVPLYAIISGFEPKHTPGVGTFYDFFARFWPLATPHVTGRHKPKRTKKPVKGKKGEKAPTNTPHKVERLVNRILLRPRSDTSLPTDRLMSLFREQFVQISVKLGLIGDVGALSVAGDGTPVRTAAFPRSKRICSCREQGIEKCTCNRLYSNPIATLDGTAIATATTLATISTCSRLLTATLTFRSTRDWDQPPAMTLSHSLLASKSLISTILTGVGSGCCLMLPTMPCPFTVTLRPRVPSRSST